MQLCRTTWNHGWWYFLGFFVIQDWVRSLEVIIHSHEFETCPFNVGKELCWNFYWECIENLDCSCRMCTFTMLNLPIHEHGSIFHLLILSTVTFSKDWSFYHRSISLACLEFTQDILYYYEDIVKSVVPEYFLLNICIHERYF